MGFANKAIAAACAGFAAAALVGCGSGGNLLSRDQANALSHQLQRASVALADSNCSGAHGAIRQFTSDVNNLGGVNSTLRSNLQQGGSAITRLTDKQCPTHHSTAPATTTTQAATTAPAPAPKPKPKPAPTTTTTAPTTTTPAPPTPTATTPPTPSTPAGTTTTPATGGTGLPGNNNSPGQANNAAATPATGPQGHAYGYYRHHGPGGGGQ